MICAIYVITGLAGGPSFWDRGILTVTGLEHVDWIAKGYAWLNVPLNDAFMTFGALGLAANVLARLVRSRCALRALGSDAAIMDYTLMLSTKPRHLLSSPHRQLRQRDPSTSLPQRIRRDAHLWSGAPPFAGHRQRRMVER